MPRIISRIIDQYDFEGPPLSGKPLVYDSATQTFKTLSPSGNGTVNYVSGSGTVNGITLTGNVTSSGALTLGGSLSNVSLLSQVSGILPIANGGTSSSTATGALAALGAIGSITSTNGSVSVASSGTNVDLSVTTASATNNVIVQVRNNTGATLTKGTVVYINNAIGQIPTVAKALATSDATSAQTLGMISENLADNSNGYVTIIGLIDDIDTNSYQDGDQLYLSGTTAGTFTNTKPYAPTHLVYVGVVQYAHQNHGKIFVKVQNGYELDELHDVVARYPTSGQTIVYNSASGLWLTAPLPLTAGVTGILPIANGGTNNSALGTSGAVLYFDGSKVQGQSLLSYTSSGIGINTATPSGALQLNTLSSSGKGLIVQSVSGQTANLQEWSNSSGTALSYIDASGKLYNNNLLALPKSSGAGNNINIIAGSGVSSGAGGSVILQAGIQATTGGDGKVIVRQASGQTSSLQEWQDSSGSVLASLATIGRVTAPYLTANGGTYAAATPAITLAIGAGAAGFYWDGSYIRAAQGSNSGFKLKSDSGQIILNENGQPGSTSGQLLVSPGTGGGAQVNCLAVKANPNQGSYLMYTVTGHGAMTVAPDVPSVSCATLNGSVAYSLTATTKSLTSNVATITVSGGTPRIDVGDTVVVALSPADAVFDGTYTISAKSGTNLSYARTNTNVTSTATGGTVSSTATATLQNINIGVPGAKGSVIKGAASQTANLQEWQNSAGTALAYVNASGSLFENIINAIPIPVAATVTAATGNGTTVTYTCANTFSVGQIVSVTGLTITTGASLNIANMTIATVSSTQFTVTNATVGTAAATQAGTATIQSAGNSLAITAGNGSGVGAGGSIILTAGIQATSGGDGKVIVKQAVGQTGNLFEVQNSSSGVLTSIGSSGAISLFPYGTGLGNTNEIRFVELAANGTEYVGFKGANVIPSSIVWTLPSGDGSTGQALVTNGSGLLSWATAGGGGGTGTVTSVSGTGSVNGLTLTGTVTSSGSLTLGGTLSNISLTTAVGGILPIANGGTNLSSIGSANQILGTNSGASALEYKTLTPGSGISISNTVGAITINSSGLTTNALTIGDGLTGGSFNGSSATTINVNSSGYINTANGTTSSYNLGTSSFVKANPSTAGLTINGFSSSGSYDGRNVKLVNVSNYNITIANTGTTVCVGGNDIILGSKDAAELILDSGASVWRVF